MLLVPHSLDLDAVQVPADRIEYLQGSGWLQAKGDEAQNAFFVVFCE